MIKVMFVCHGNIHTYAWKISVFRTKLVHDWQIYRKFTGNGWKHMFLQ